MSFQLAARVLTLPIKPAPKIILLAYADAANDDGTGAWPGATLLAQYAQCDERTVRRHREWLIDRGYLREGDQSHPSLTKLPRDRRPIAYDVAASEPQRYAWEQERAAGSRGRRDQFAEAGRKGNEVRAVKMSARANAPVIDPWERADNHDRPGRTVVTAKPTHVTNPQSSIDSNSSVEITHVVPDGSADGANSDDVHSKEEEDEPKSTVVEFPYRPCRLRGLDDAGKTQRLTGEWISVLRQYSFEPNETARRDVGNAIKAWLTKGCENRKLIDMVRRDAVQRVEKARQFDIDAQQKLSDGLAAVADVLGDLSDTERALATQTLTDGHPTARAVQVVQNLRDACPYNCAQGTYVDAGSTRDCPQHAETVARSRLLAGETITEVVQRTGIERRTVEQAAQVAFAPADDCNAATEASGIGKVVEAELVDKGSAGPGAIVEAALGMDENSGMPGADDGAARDGAVVAVVAQAKNAREQAARPRRNGPCPVDCVGGFMLVDGQSRYCPHCRADVADPIGAAA